jgi:hypothetical protein
MPALHGRAADNFDFGVQPQDREGPRPDHPAVAAAASGSGDRIVALTKRRVCALCGRVFPVALLLGEPERERDKLCDDCARLPAPPDESA